MSHLKIPVHVEIIIKDESQKTSSEIILEITEILQSCQVFYNGLIFDCKDKNDYIEIKVCDIAGNKMISFWQAELCLHAFKLSEQECEKDYLEGESDLPACDQWELPNKNLNGFWDTIIVEDDIKNSLLGYCDSSMQFSDAGIDSNIISWNRIGLLYGPPGSGKIILYLLLFIIILFIF